MSKLITKLISKILEVITVVFITMKMTDYVDWSWWLVLMPTIGPLIMAIIFIFTYALLTFLEVKIGKN